MYKKEASISRIHSGKMYSNCQILFFLYSLTFRNEISQIHTKREDWKSRRLKECVKGDKKSLGLNICNTIKLQK